MRWVKANARGIALQVVELCKSASTMADTVRSATLTSKVMLYFLGFESAATWISDWLLVTVRRQAQGSEAD